MDDPNPLALAIVKADVNIEGAWPGTPAGEHANFSYVVYVFDCKTGVPMQMGAKRDGDTLRRVLNPAERIVSPPRPIMPAGALPAP